MEKSNKPKNNFTGTGRTDSNTNSNMIRSFFFIMIMAVLIGFLVSSFNNTGSQKTEVPLSEVIARANDPNGDIKKITVTGSTLDITL